MTQYKIPWLVRSFLVLVLVLAFSHRSFSQDVTSATVSMTLPNETTIGTAISCLAKVIPGGAGGQGQLIKATTGDTTIELFVVTLSAGTTGNGVFVVAGQASLLMDNAVTSSSGHYVMASTTTPCYGHVLTTPPSTPPPNGMVIGTLLQDTTSIGQVARIKALNTNYSPGTGTSGSGTVTSAGLNMPGEFVVGGSPITGASAFTVTKSTQNANFAWMGPASGPAAVSGFRAIVAQDITAALSTTTAGGGLAGNYPNPSVINAAGAFAFAGFATPTALIGDPTNNYNPTGFASNVVIRIDGQSTDKNITGFQAQNTGDIKLICNAGATNALILKDQNGGSTPVNQLLLGGSDVTILPKQCAPILYDTTGGTQKWLGIGNAIPDIYKVRAFSLPFGDPGANSPFLLTDNDAPAVFRNKYGRNFVVLEVECYAKGGALGDVTVLPILSGGAANSILTNGTACACGVDAYNACSVNGAPVVPNNTNMDVNINAVATTSTVKYVDVSVKGILQ